MSNIGKAWKDLFKENKNAYKIKLNKFILFLFYHQPMNRLIRKCCQVKNNTLVLEPGCGSGKLGLTMSLSGADVTALDFSEQMLNNVNDLKKRAEKICSKKLKLKIVKGNLTKLDFEDSSFDVVFNEGVVEHWIDKEERMNVIKEMYRVAKPNGFVAIIVPNGKHPFHNRWKEYYTFAPPMTNYSVDKLRGEMEQVGLKFVYSDGFKPWSSLIQWPEYKLLSPIISLMNLFFPLTKKFRERWGPNIICIGKK
jgi:ubiquinone/menaquinone biosynthesis C-methylase UbiE